jgi:hypothetical protein
MPDTAKATADLINQVIEEYGGKLKFDHTSKILCSDANVARAMYEGSKDYRSSFGPQIVIASRGGESESSSDLDGIATLKALDDLEMDHYTHAVWGLAGEDPKTILHGFKYMIHALRPKGIAIVTSLKQKTGEGEGGQYSVGLEEKMMYQSKGKINNLGDVLEYAGFEKGKIRSQEKTTEAGGEKQDAEVVLAINWDQLTG